MPKLKGILLDLDQTLANTEDFVLPYSTKPKSELIEYKLFEYLLPVLKTVTWEEFLDLYSRARQEIRSELKGSAAAHNRYLYIQRTLEMCGVNFAPSIIQRAVEFYFDELLKKTKLYDGVFETLQLFKSHNLKTCLITDFTADIQNKEVLKLGIEKYIDYMVTSEEAGADKPGVEQAVLALKKLKLNQEEVFVIGNNPKTDIEVARRMGIKSVLFDADSKHEDESEKATYYTKHFSDIPKLLGLPTKKFSSKKVMIIDFVGTLTNEVDFTENILRTFVHKESAYISAEYNLFRKGQITEAEMWYKLGVGEVEKARKTIVAAVSIRKSVVKMLERLKKDFTLVLFSDFPSQWKELMVKELGLKNYFSGIYFASEFGVSKESKAAFEKLMEKLPNINPESIVVIDDNQCVLSGARDIMMKTVLVKRSGSSNTVFVPDYVVEDVLDIENIDQIV